MTATSGSVNEFRIFNDAESSADIAFEFAAGPDSDPEPMSMSLAIIGGSGAGDTILLPAGTLHQSEALEGGAVYAIATRPPANPISN